MGSAYNVEGDWNEFTFKIIRKEDYPKVLEHLNNTFYRDEPHLKHFGYTEETALDLDKLVLGALEQNDFLSFCAIEKETGKIAGVRITFKASKNDPESTTKFDSFPVNFLMKLLTQMAEKANIFDRYNADSYGTLLMASVDPEFRERGLVTEMYKRTIQLLRSLNFVAAETICSNPITRNVTAKLGFEELCRIYFHEYVDEEGKRILPKANDDECSALMVLKL